MQRINRWAGACVVALGFFVSSSSSFAAVDLNKGLVGHWPLDEGAGKVARDHSPNGHNGSVNGGAAYIEGRVGGALGLDGEGAHVLIPAAEHLDFEGRITLAAWVKPKRGQHDPAQFISHGIAGRPWRAVQLGLFGKDYTVRTLRHLDQGMAMHRWDTAKDVDRWVHIAGLYDGTTWRLYRDGVEINAEESEFAAVKVPGGWAIGAKGDGKGEYFTGGIDDVRIYNRGLSAEEVAALAKGVAAGPPPVAKVDPTEPTQPGATTKPGAGQPNAPGTKPTIDAKGLILHRELAKDEGVFNGRRSISLKDVPKLGELTDTFAVSAWISAAEIEGTHQIIGTEALSGGWALGIHEKKGLVFTIFGEGEVYSRAALVKNRWYHVAASVNKAGRVVLYVNGAPSFSFSNEMAIKKTKDAFAIGVASDKAVYFKGQIRDVRVYEREFARSEIDTLVKAEPTLDAKLAEGVLGTGETASNPSEAYYKQMEAAYLAGEWERFEELYKTLAQHRPNLSRDQNVNLTKMKRQYPNYTPSWWKHTSSSSNVSFKAEIWRRKFTANYVPSEELGLQAPVGIRDGKMLVIVTWRPGLVNDDRAARGELAEYHGFKESDIGEVIVWHELGHNYITNFLPLSHVLALYENHHMLFGSLQEFYADMTAIHHCSPAARRVCMLFRLRELGYYDESETHTRAAHAVGSIFLAEVMSNPDDWPSIHFPPKVWKENVELNTIAYVYETIDKGWTYEEDERWRKFVETWIRSNGERALRGKGQIKLGNGLEMKIIASEDRDLQKKRDAWVAKKIEEFAAKGRADAKMPELGKLIAIPGFPEFVVPRHEDGSVRIRR